MNRVLEIESALHRLLAVDETNLVVNSDWNDIADDIIRKLNMIREQCCQSLSPRPSSECSPHPSVSPRPPNHHLTPPPSTLSSAAASEISETSSTPCTDISYQSAVNAFNREIFSRCVQIVEAADKQGHTEMQMISLAHHSYIAMVNEADRSEDALKLARYWNSFLENVQRGRPNNELLEILDMQVVALENLMELDDASHDLLAEKLLAVLVKSYEISCIVNRHFHSRTLRRLERIAAWLQDENHYGNVDEVKQLIQRGIDDATIDRYRYEVETKLTIRERFDPNYTLCCEILRVLSLQPSTTNVTSDDTSLEHSLTESMEKENWFLSTDSECPETNTSDDDVVIRL